MSSSCLASVRVTLPVRPNSRGTNAKEEEKEEVEVVEGKRVWVCAVRGEIGCNRLEMERMGKGEEGGWMDGPEGKEGVK